MPRISTISAKVMNSKIDESCIQNNAKTHVSSNMHAAAIHKLEIARLYLFTSHTIGRFVNLKKHTAFVSLRAFTPIIRKIIDGMLQIINFIIIILPI